MLLTAVHYLRSPRDDATRPDMSRVIIFVRSLSPPVIIERHIALFFARYAILRPRVTFVARRRCYHVDAFVITCLYLLRVVRC